MNSTRQRLLPESVHHVTYLEAARISWRFLWPSLVCLGTVLVALDRFGLLLQGLLRAFGAFVIYSMFLFAFISRISSHQYKGFTIGFVKDSSVYTGMLTIGLRLAIWKWMVGRLIIGTAFSFLLVAPVNLFLALFQIPTGVAALLLVQALVVNPLLVIFLASETLSGYTLTVFPGASQKPSVDP
jgi:hypothetical protein